MRHIGGEIAVHRIAERYGVTVVTSGEQRQERDPRTEEEDGEHPRMRRASRAHSRELDTSVVASTVVRHLGHGFSGRTM
jgi:hypothetical protein